MFCFNNTSYIDRLISCSGFVCVGFFFSPMKVSSADGGEMSLFRFSGSAVVLDIAALVNSSVPRAG